MDVTFSLSVIYLEVYREVIRDLLDPSKSNLSVRESTSKGVRPQPGRKQQSGDVVGWGLW